ncbi:zinc-dependent metalloprotease [Tunturiibacter lichenicola]|uniref:zinc-dependent metalloprotease n=1 Tax=Tunturiibacter lichenicola TaxID=2051959 RepID=UPI0021B1C5B7|nr:zinc-dependent metalloprotease [Edaphobacter lichenicola]
MPKRLPLALLVVSAILPATLSAQNISSKTTGMKHIDGYLPLDWDAKAGKLYLEVPHLETDILYTHSLPYGTGSNDLGLDRGQISEGQIVRFERTGPKVLLVQPNQQFRSSSTDPAELLAVRQSFPESVLFGFKVEAEDPNGTVLVDATDFYLRDAHGVAEALTQTRQGTYKVDLTRSTIALDATKAFPKNTEVESILTFITDDPSKGEFVANVTPDPHALTVREHQSFIELPGPGFTPRRFDPRAGYFPTGYRDYNVPVSESLDQQFIIRHRLIKKDPSCKTACEPVAPIQYYIDRGAAEPIRTALLEGARWWDQAFQAAGWAKGTFRVDVLPADADPMDIRYNIIQWVHRYTRGWSYGSAVVDPRTGEVLKGNVTLGSLRSRQDYLIDEALLSPYLDGKPLPPATDPMLAMVLARTRQLAAHETGHTLGLAHNFAASSFPHTPEESVSVMDYPHPWITLDKNGTPNIAQSYATNIGIWDKVAIDYGYREFDIAGKPKEDPSALNAILTASAKTGLIYITDDDARALGGAHPHGHLWDNGTDPADELDRILTIRAAALKRFGENAIKTGTPMAQLEDTLVPLYLLERYQTEAAAKEIGGLDYRYNLRGDGQINPAIVSPDAQRKALTAVLKTLSPETLTIPESLLQILPPRPPGLPRTRESFPSETGLTFDPIAAAESSADLTLAVLLDPARASRLVQYHMRVPDAPSLRSVLEAVSKATAERPEGGHTMSSEVERAVEFRALEAMLSLAVNPQASSQARAIARSHVNDVLKQLTVDAQTPQTDTAEAIHRAALIDRINQFERDPAKFIPAPPIAAPPGMPIGDDEEMD